MADHVFIEQELLDLQGLLEDIYARVSRNCPHMANQVVGILTATAGSFQQVNDAFVAGGTPYLEKEEHV